MIIKVCEKTFLDPLSASGYSRFLPFHLQPLRKSYVYFLDSLFHVSVTSQK